MSSQTGKMKITIEAYGNIYSATLSDASNAQEAQEVFDRLLIQVGYASDIRCSDGSRFELTYKEEDEGE